MIGSSKLRFAKLRTAGGWGKEQQALDDLNYLVEEDAMPTPAFTEGEKVMEAKENVVALPVATPAEKPAEETQATAAATSKKETRYPIELTPEELLMETGISDVREIERRMREEDPDLAKFDDMDEELEWEVVTPETYGRTAR